MIIITALRALVSVYNNLNLIHLKCRGLGIHLKPGYILTNENDKQTGVSIDSL